jgi:hypothetical protein
MSLPNIRRHLLSTGSQELKYKSRIKRYGFVLSVMLAVCSFASDRARAANEVMTDRCSKEVAITPTYDAQPTAANTVILTRGQNGWSAWTKPFRVSLDGSGHIRWWCHSTTGNFFDLGTWRLGAPAKVASCAEGIGAVAETGDASGLASCKDAVKPGASAFQGWTPERSRCSNHSSLIRARLGTNRLLQIECLGH